MSRQLSASFTKEMKAKGTVVEYDPASPSPFADPATMKPLTVSGYDYENQAWVIDGLYVDCGHDHNKPCPGGNCFGRVHNGEPATGNIR
jgi:hypothetical protein